MNNNSISGASNNLMIRTWNKCNNKLSNLNNLKMFKTQETTFSSIKHYQANKEKLFHNRLR